MSSTNQNSEHFLSLANHGFMQQPWLYQSDSSVCKKVSRGLTTPHPHSDRQSGPVLSAFIVSPGDWAYPTDIHGGWGKPKKSYLLSFTKASCMPLWLVEKGLLISRRWKNSLCLQNFYFCKVCPQWWSCNLSFPLSLSLVLLMSGGVWRVEKGWEIERGRKRGRQGGVGS